MPFSRSSAACRHRGAPALAAAGRLRHLSTALRHVSKFRAFPPWKPENTVQHSLAFNHSSNVNEQALFVRDSVGAVRPASRDEILGAAREAILQVTEPGQCMAAPSIVRDFLRLRLNSSLPREIFAVLYLNSQNQLLAFEEPFAGTLAEASVYPRDIVRAAILHNAAAVILAHNHPSGCAEPSKSDINLTAKVRDALALVGTRVIDHMVISASEVTSMAERGLL